MHVACCRYTLDQQVKPTPPFPVHPHPAKQGKVSAVNHPPPSPRAPPIHPPSQARPRLHRMDAADPHSNDYDNRGRVQDESVGSTAPRQGIAPITPRGGSASRQRYPPPLQNGPAQGGNQERGPPKQVSFAVGRYLFSSIPILDWPKIIFKKATFKLRKTAYMIVP